MVYKIHIYFDKLWFLLKWSKAWKEEPNLQEIMSMGWKDHWLKGSWAENQIAILWQPEKF